MLEATQGKGVHKGRRNTAPERLPTSRLGRSVATKYARTNRERRDMRMERKTSERCERQDYTASEGAVEIAH
jgi:hypothetical protein